jgi:acetyl esterase/lipase
MKRIVTVLTLVTLTAVTARGLTPDEPLVLDVWPGKAPGETGPIGEEKPVEEKPFGFLVKGVTNVSRPTLTVYRPAKDTGAAVLVCPGGGYNIVGLNPDAEGAAPWLNSLGVTAIVLKYRVPRGTGQPTDSPPPGPLQDAQRALSLVRHKARDWGIDPNRIGMLGFSAGGHLTAAASTGFDRHSYERIDEVDQISCRPDFAMVVYPGLLLARDQEGLAPQI